MKQEDGLLSVQFCIALVCAIKKEQETNLGLYINVTYYVLAYVDGVSLIGYIRTIEINADLLLNSCKGKLHESGTS